MSKSKVITFETVFPTHHRKAGQPTLFVEQIFASLFRQGKANANDVNIDFFKIYALASVPSLVEKIHTIQHGNRFKVGDKFRPCIWSGAPCQSKKIQFAPEIEVCQVWDIEICLAYETIKINNREISSEEILYNITTFDLIAHREGLTTDDFIDWFGNKPFKGQIISWCETISY